jgi:DNA-binding MarR family transcriptional regulator
VAAILKARRQRADILGSDLFADPAWDMLLELYAAHLGQFELSVTSVCLGSGVPASTALRWMGEMEKRGLLDRRPDPMDGRRVLVRMSDTGRARMDQLFEKFSVAEMFT